MTISIVITAYNVGKYIEKSINSVLNQTYKDIELIVVEDCSTDNTLEIVNKFKDKLKLVKHDTNVGAGLSRRDGIKTSTGDFILLLDADDWLSSNYIEQLVKRQKETDADIVSGGMTTVFESNDRYETKTFGTICSEGIQKFVDYNNGKIVFLNNKIVRKSLYDNVEYCDRRYVEDTPVIMKLLYYANKVAYVNDAGYHYLQRDNSLCHTASPWKHNIFCALCTAELIEWFKTKEAPYNNLFKLPQFINYFKMAQNSKPTNEDMCNNINEYTFCINYLLNYIH